MSLDEAQEQECVGHAGVQRPGPRQRSRARALLRPPGSGPAASRRRSRAARSTKSPMPLVGGQPPRQPDHRAGALAAGKALGSPRPRRNRFRSTAPGTTSVGREPAAPRPASMASLAQRSRSGGATSRSTRAPASPHPVRATSIAHQTSGSRGAARRLGRGQPAHRRGRHDHIDGSARGSADPPRPGCGTLPDRRRRAGPALPSHLARVRAPANRASAAISAAPVLQPADQPAAGAQQRQRLHAPTRHLRQDRGHLPLDAAELRRGHHEQRPDRDPVPETDYGTSPALPLLPRTRRHL